MRKLDYRLVVGLLLVSVIATSAIWYVLAATPSSTIWISPGVYPGAPSYTVWKEGSNYFAKDANGEIEFSSTNASEVINDSVVGIDSAGGKIMLIGTISLSSSIVTPFAVGSKDLIFEGEGLGRTRLQWAGAVDGYIFDFRNTVGRHIIRNMWLHGASISGVTGILFGGVAHPVSWNHKIENVRFSHLATGLDMGSQGGQCEDVDFIGLMMVDISEACFKFKGMANTIIGGAFGGTTSMIAMQYLETTTSTDLTVHGGGFGTAQEHIRLVSTNAADKFLSFFGTYFELSVDGLITSNSSDTTGTERLAFYNCELHTSSVSNIINTINFSNVALEVIGGQCGGDSNVLTFGSGGWRQLNLINSPFDIKTSNSGNRTIATGGTVTHGLGITPTSITVTAAESGPTDIYLSAIGDTTFAINFGAGGTKNFYWSAEYKP